MAHKNAEHIVFYYAPVLADLEAPKSSGQGRRFPYHRSLCPSMFATKQTGIKVTHYTKETKVTKGWQRFRDFRF
jgi:hypothetical protein